MARSEYLKYLGSLALSQDVPTLPMPRENYCDKGGHRKRSIANDHRKRGHKEHWKKESKRRDLDNGYTTPPSTPLPY
jgi:hypothetical protein